MWLIFKYLIYFPLIYHISHLQNKTPLKYFQKIVKNC